MPPLNVTIEHPRTHKVWGYEVEIVNTWTYCGKLLVLKKGMRCSLHHHEKKDETFYVSKGVILLETLPRTSVGLAAETEKAMMIAGCSYRILPGVWHRFTGLSDAEIIEFSTHHEDEDSYRVEGQLSGEAPKEIMDEFGRHTLG